ncbi:hypothetical protein E2C01_017528 [Portunus trituberculatus]|uniref:Uncharacterized protein n=1 Tax=Portunus trituberculatus TaxID=210409 RepID=A0A5B7DTQ9_PORTR|nr:hypothetical protein [Portunus trituberculatus]
MASWRELQRWGVSARQGAVCSGWSATAAVPSRFRFFPDKLVHRKILLPSFSKCNLRREGICCSGAGFGGGGGWVATGSRPLAALSVTSVAGVAGGGYRWTGYSL